MQSFGKPPPPASVPPYPQRRRRSRWGLWDAIGSLVAFVVLTVGTGVVLVGLGVDPVTASIVSTPMGWLALGGWPLIATSRRGDGPRRDLDLEFRAADIGWGLATAGVVFLAGIVFVAVYIAVVGEDPSSTVGEIAEASSRDWQVLLLAAVALGAAVVEEIHFRGLWWNALRRRRVPPWATLLITAAIFSCVHLEPARAPLLFVIGLGIGFVRMRTNRLGPAIAAHVVVNGVAGLSLLTML